ncbi:hypothetical protein BJ742DRAFT_411071 [Cladochytrium replicatum]|nr:hypothetical protein BJ742DRAFT_411071 [Cladochytrium replicatum]
MLTSIKKSLKVRRESKVCSRLSSVSTFGGGTPSTSIRAIGRISHILELMDDDLAIVLSFIDPLTRAKLRLVCKRWNRQLSNKRHWVLNDFSGIYKRTTPKVINVVSTFISEQLALVNLCSCFQLYDDDILTLVSNCTNIASLGLSNCWKLTDRGLSYVAQSLLQLQALDISYCGQMTGSGFADHRWSAMRRVDLTYCKQVGDEQLEKLLSRTTDIDELRLRRCTRITDFGIFLVVRYCRYLQSLDLSDCDQIPDKCLKWIAGSCFNLIHLNLTFCTRLTNGGLYNLSLGAQQFESMNLSYCSHLTDAAIMFFGDHAKSFRRISFRRCPKMTDKVVLFLSRSSPLLEHLDLTGCPNISKGSVAFIHSTIGAHVRVLVDAPIPQLNRTKPIATEAPIEEVFTSVPRSMRSPKVAPAAGKHKRRGSRDRGSHKKSAAAGSSK